MAVFRSAPASPFLSYLRALLPFGCGPQVPEAVVEAAVHVQQQRGVLHLHRDAAEEARRAVVS